MKTIENKALMRIYRKDLTIPLKGSVSYSSAFEYLGKKVDVVLEFLGDKDGFQDYLAGVRYRIIDGFAVGVAYGNGFKESRQKITAGSHYEF